MKSKIRFQPGKGYHKQRLPLHSNIIVSTHYITINISIKKICKYSLVIVYALRSNEADIIALVFQKSAVL